MFTGIVEELGEVAAVQWGAGQTSAVLSLRGPLATSGVAHGASVAVNGVCLTVTSWSGDTFDVDVMAETLHRSSLGALSVGDRVNLERAMPAGGRFGGHIVQGHVDGTGTIESVTVDGFSNVVRIECGQELLRYIVEKGSIAVDGISLTVSAIDAEGFTVSLIPETIERTTLGSAAPGRVVNLEVDVLAKYVEKLTDGVRS